MMNALLKQRAKKLTKNKKGFTLVELIVVLVILAILAAIAIPSMMKYVNDARDKTLVAEARNAYTAAQGIASEKIGVNAGALVLADPTATASDGIGKTGDTDPAQAAYVKSTEWQASIDAFMDGNMAKTGATVVVKLQQTADAAANVPVGKVTKIIYTNGNKQVVYEAGKEPQVTDKPAA